VTFKRQINKEEEVYMSVRGTQAGVTREIKGNTDLQETDMYVLEIFDRNGILLGEIPLSQFVDGIYIKHDSLFMLDQMRGVKYYQYKIVEND
jgi:hypothetical protein